MALLRIGIFIRMAVEPFLYQSFEIVIFLLSHTSISLIVLQGLSSFLRQYPCLVPKYKEAARKRIGDDRNPDFEELENVL